MNVAKVVKYLKEKFDLKYYIYNKSNSYSLPFSVRLEAILENKKYMTWGVSTDPDLAFYKALMEMFERIFINNNCPVYFKKKSLLSKSLSIESLASQYNLKNSLLCPSNSNGCSISFSINKSRESALNELIERHTILSAILYNIGPTEVDFSIKPFSLSSSNSLRFFYWKASSRFVSVCVSIDDHGGYYFGFGCSSNLDKSLYRSFEELVPGIIFSNNDIHLKKYGIEIQQNDIQSFSRYWRFSKDTRILDFFCSGPGIFKKSLDLKDVYYGFFSTPDFIPAEAKKLVCIRAISPQAQNLFFDKWDYSYINPIVFPKGDLPDFPHPIA